MEYQEAAASTQREGNARRGFYIHLTAYLVVNVLLVGINFATSTNYLWFKWPLLGWGVGILAHGLATFALPKRSGMKRR